ncbi:hypothetical protein PTE30175_05299 [Pandoraea terrae]|uniref:Uncharacterized protein n=1 Tax=Pandoraea terrae TaxID=1537710 RepID=A0A5E4ZEP0_9BURK|nr:hypothetical protein PTE30175_05299 [Pandoraea terrae]
MRAVTSRTAYSVPALSTSPPLAISMSRPEEIVPVLPMPPAALSDMSSVACTRPVTVRRPDADR